VCRSHGGAGEQQAEVVEQQRPTAQVPPLRVGDAQEQAAGRAGIVEVVEGDAGEFREGDGEQCEVDAANAEAEAKPADHGRERGGNCNRREHPEPRPDAKLYEEQRGHIAAEPDIERVAERQLPGEAHHQVPGLTHQGEIEHHDED
jgi:hypothetical protein